MIQRAAESGARARGGWLDGESIVVTGGGSGLGRALVSRFLDEGASVTVLENSTERCAQLRDEVPTVGVVEGDVTRYADNVSAVYEAIHRFGKVSCLVANAGIFDVMRTLDDLSADDLNAAFDEIFSVNVKAVLFGAKAALPELRRSTGSLILTLSNAGLYPGGGGPLYVASKHAGVGLVRQLAYEWAPHVRVNGVAPGGMATNLRGPRSIGLDGVSLNGAFDIGEMMQKHGPLRTAFTADDYTGAFVLLASRRDGRAATGTILDVTGGMGIAYARPGE